MIIKKIHFNITKQQGTLLNIFTNLGKDTIKFKAQHTINYKIISLNYYKNNHSNINNLIIYYKINSLDDKTKFIKLLNKFPPQFFTYIYICSDYNYIISRDTLKLNNIKVYKFINVFFDKDKGGSYDRYVDKLNTDEKEEFIIDYIVIKPDDYDFLHYKYMYSPNIGKGRLIQLKGTCYFNAAINSIIFTPLLANKIKEAINNKTKLIYIEDFFKDLLINKKYDSYDDKSNDFLAKLAHLYKKDTFNFNLFSDPEGGKALFVLYYIITKIFGEKSLYIINDISFGIKIIYNYNNKYDKNKTKFICNIDIPRKYIIINDIKYKLICSIIALRNKNRGHGVAAYIYNKKYYIFDSNNYNYEIDWRNPENLKNIMFYVKNFNIEEIIYHNIYMLK
jgi:hypothetical protein